MITGENLRLLRVSQGLKQKAAASLLGISQPAYSKLEKRKMLTPVSYQRVLASFGCSEDHIKKLKEICSQPG